MVHTRIRPFNTRVTYPEQALDNDLAQAVVAGNIVFLRGQPLLEGFADPPDAAALKQPVVPGISRETGVYAACAAALFVVWELIQHDKVVGAFLIVFGIVVLVTWWQGWIHWAE